MLGGTSLVYLFNTRVGITNAAPEARLDVNQSIEADGIPPLKLRQADDSEEFIRFVGTAASGVLTNSLVDHGEVMTATLQGWIKVYVRDDGNRLTDQAYFVPIYTLA